MSHLDRLIGSGRDLTTAFSWAALGFASPSRRDRLHLADEVAGAEGERQLLPARSFGTGRP
jgi:hypothetical protein